MGETLAIASYNILENGTVTVAAGADTGYPVSRLYDRSISLYWKLTAGGDIYEIGPMGNDTYEIGSMDGDTYDLGPLGDDGGGITLSIQVQQDGGSPRLVDTLYVAGHNFDGKNCYWQWSEDGSNWTDAITSWLQGNTDPIIKTLDTPIMHSYWRLLVYSAINPTASEVIMGMLQSFGIQRRPSPSHGYRDFVSWTQSVSGSEIGVKLGNDKRRRRYTLRVENGDFAALRSVFTDLDEWSRPFVIKDKDGNYFMARFTVPPEEIFITNLLTEIDIDLKEI